VDLSVAVRSVRGHLAAFAEVDEIVGAVPILNHVQPFIDFLPQFHRLEIAAQENRFERLP
jgi:hypothetical protein